MALGSARPETGGAAILGRPHMEAAEYEALAQAERTHPWFQNRRLLVERLARRFCLPWPPQRILDAGCGTGANLARWVSWGAPVVAGAELEQAALTKARHLPGRPLLVRADLKRLPLTSEFFDLVICTDVLEHIQQDAQVTRELYRVLRHWGLMILTVPAYSWAFSYHDRHLHHVRRYDPSPLAQLLRRCGFAICFWSHYNCLPALPLVIYRCVAWTRESSDVAKAIPPALAPVLAAIWKVEAQLAARLRLPMGMTHVVVCRKGS
jgi:SAM-dependent methyltransferase